MNKNKNGTIKYISSRVNTVSSKVRNDDDDDDDDEVPSYFPKSSHCMVVAVVNYLNSCYFLEVFDEGENTRSNPIGDGLGAEDVDAECWALRSSIMCSSCVHISRNDGRCVKSRCQHASRRWENSWGQLFSNFGRTPSRITR